MSSIPSQIDSARPSSSESNDTTDSGLESFLDNFSRGGCWGYTIFRTYTRLHSSDLAIIPPELTGTDTKFTVQGDTRTPTNTARRALAGQKHAREESPESQTSSFDFDRFFAQRMGVNISQSTRMRRDNEEGASSTLGTGSAATSNVGDDSPLSPSLLHQKQEGIQMPEQQAVDESELWVRIYTEIRRQMLAGVELPGDPSPRYQSSYELCLRTPVEHLPGVSRIVVRRHLAEAQKKAYRENDVRGGHMCNTHWQNLGIIVDKEVARSVLRGGPDAAVKVVDSEYVPQLGPDGQECGYMRARLASEMPSNRPQPVYYGWVWTKLSYLYVLWNHASGVGLGGLCDEGHDFV